METYENSYTTFRVYCVDISFLAGPLYFWLFQRWFFVYVSSLMEIYLIILIRRHQRCKNRHCVKCIICIKYMVDISANPKWLYVVQGIDHGREGVTTTTPEWFVVRHRDKFSERLITATEDLEVFRKTYELLWKTYKFSGKLTNLSIVLTNFSGWFITSPEILKISGKLFNCSGTLL